MDFQFSPYNESDAVKKRREELQKYETYNESADVKNARNELNTIKAQRPQSWNGGTYGETIKNLANDIANRKQFSYDVNGDALYQQYKDKYINLGRMAMQDTVGQAAQLTGGYGNSYATTAGSQAYQGYLQQLNDVVPQLYQMAMEKYELEGQGMRDNLNMYNNLYGNEYGEYRDRVGDWNNDYDRANSNYQYYSNADWGRYNDNRNYALNVYGDERDFDVKMWDTANDLAYKNYQLANPTGGGSGRGGSGGGSSQNESTEKTYDDWRDEILYIAQKSGEGAARAYLNNAVKNGEISQENWNRWAMPLGQAVTVGKASYKK